VSSNCGYISSAALAL